MVNQGKLLENITYLVLDSVQEPYESVGKNYQITVISFYSNIGCQNRSSDVDVDQKRLKL